MSDAFEEHTIQTRDGQSLYYRDYNPNSTLTAVLCLSGLTRNSRDYATLAPHLVAQGRRVIALDYRGRGRSTHDPDWRNYRPFKMLGDVVHLTRTLHLRHAIVIGTSLGGLLAMGLAAVRPGFITGAIINDIGPDLHAEGIPRISAYVGIDHPQPDWPSAIVHLKACFLQLGIERDADWQALAEGTFDQREDGLLHVNWDTNIAKTLLRGARSPVPLWLVYRALRHVPTLAIRGGQSDVLSQATFDRMAEVKPDLIRLTIPGAGHTPTLDEPKSRQAIDAFLAVLG